ncbi:adenosylmethionine--8-amino-7-oxononanoate transaminase [Flavobacteriaceae bacterium]|nr:adenosylmethionine--8-amino-7-oxononanoate transaminase [Flavobacteriaceae bacterium]
MNDFDQNNIWLPYTQMQQAPTQLQVSRTKGSKIFLENGKILLDGVAAWWSVAHGYNHPHISQAIKKQLRDFPHIMMAGLKSEQTYRLAERLVKITPDGLNKVFFSDSGSTAVEVAMKMAVQFHINKKQPEKTKFISFYNGYHGDTAGCMSLADLSSGMHQKFQKFLPKNHCVKLPKTQDDLNEFEDFIKSVKDESVAVIIEPLVQCAGGMLFHDAEILRQIFTITKKHGLLFIADECAVGFWRTGLPFACDHAQITPDIMVLGKALTGGFMTLAATIATDEIYDNFLGDSLDKALMHGPTFMGNPLACAALFSSALEVGAIITNQNKDNQRALREFGNNFGVVFQIMDDVLDYHANTEDIGKHVGDDFAERKVTLPIILLYKDASMEDKKIIGDIFQNDYEDEDSFKQILELMKKYNALDKSLEIAHDFQKKAIAELIILPDNKERHMLRCIVEGCIKFRV